MTLFIVGCHKQIHRIKQGVFMKFLAKTCQVVVAILLACTVFIGQAGMSASAASSTPEYREILFVNNTGAPVEIGYFHKSSRHSPSTFQSSGHVPAQESAKLAVRINYQMTARTPSTNTQFQASANDKVFKISGNSHHLVVTKS